MENPGRPVCDVNATDAAAIASAVPMIRLAVSLPPADLRCAFPLAGQGRCRSARRRSVGDAGLAGSFAVWSPAFGLAAAPWRSGCHGDGRRCLPPRLCTLAPPARRKTLACCPPSRCPVSQRCGPHTVSRPCPAQRHDGRVGQCPPSGLGAS